MLPGWLRNLPASNNRAPLDPATHERDVLAMSDWVIMGRVSGLFGLQGWVKVFSHTQPRHGIVSYRSVFLEQGGAWQPFTIAEGCAQGAGVVVKFLGYENRDQLRDTD